MSRALVLCLVAGALLANVVLFAVFRAAVPAPGCALPPGHLQSLSQRKTPCSPMLACPALPTKMGPCIADPSACASVHATLVRTPIGDDTVVRVRRVAELEVPMTFVTAPRSFDGETTAVQRAAVLSWQALPGSKEILLMGDDDGVADLAREWGFRHVGGVQQDAQGVPLMHSLFRLASRVASHNVTCFINTDISLPPDWWQPIQAAVAWLVAQGRPFLLVGPRLEFHEGVMWHHSQMSWRQFHKDAVLGRKFRIPVVDGAIDWFIFRTGDYDVMPPFLLGRYVWDSWMVHHAVNSGWTTLSTLQFDGSERHAAYGLHWHHSRVHQNPKQVFDPRRGNSEVAKRSDVSPGWRYGRLRAVELTMQRCSDGDEGDFCISRPADRRDVDDAPVTVRSAA